MLKSYESPKNGDYAAYIDELLKQSSLSSPVQNKDDDVFQDPTDDFASHEAFPSEVTAKPSSYTLPPQEKPAETSKPSASNAPTLNKNIKRLVFLIFLIIFLGSILTESDGHGAIVLFIIVAIALFRFLASISTSTNSNRKK
ncbi:hypothetical protein ACM5Q9_02870 [Advenella sp. RU8]|uniref:hypothetical protein n=1 Tax=Advenella sp. RU8 TaxID=3399575 RepID=UPI003AAC7E21